MNLTKEFKTKFETFFKGCQVKVHQKYPDDILKYYVNKKYIKITCLFYFGYQESVFCFVNIETGDILLGKSWSMPDKTPRGNIFDEWNGLKRIGYFGVEYNTNDTKYGKGSASNEPN